MHYFGDPDDPHRQYGCAVWLYWLVVSALAGAASIWVAAAVAGLGALLVVVPVAIGCVETECRPLINSLSWGTIIIGGGIGLWWGSAVSGELHWTLLTGSHAIPPVWFARYRRGLLVGWSSLFAIVFLGAMMDISLPLTKRNDLSVHLILTGIGAVMGIVLAVRLRSTLPSTYLE